MVRNRKVNRFVNSCAFPFGQSSGVEDNLKTGTPIVIKKIRAGCFQVLSIFHYFVFRTIVLDT